MASSSGGITLSNQFDQLNNSDFPEFYTNNKRPCTTIDEFTTVNGQRQKHEHKFLLISHKNENENLARASPFLVQKGLDMITKGLKNVKKLKSGQLLVETKYSSQVDKLMTATTLGNILPITVKLHPHLNSSKGIVYAPDLIEISEETLKTELEDQKVVEVKRIKRLPNAKDDPKRIDSDGFVVTPLLILTFNVTVLPKKLKAGYLMINVEHYIPNPMRCKKCQRFGHTKKWCSLNACCSICSLEFDDTHIEGVLCTNNPNCANCHGSHEAFRKSCKRFKDEFAISKIKTMERITYQEAKQKFEQFNPTPKMLPMAEVIHTLKHYPSSSQAIKPQVTSRKTSPSPQPQRNENIPTTSQQTTPKSKSPVRQKSQHDPRTPKNQRPPAKEKEQASSPERLTEEQRQNLKDKLNQNISALKNNQQINQNLQQQSENTKPFDFAVPQLRNNNMSESDFESSSSTQSNIFKQNIKKTSKNKNKNKNKAKNNTMDTD